MEWKGHCKLNRHQVRCTVRILVPPFIHNCNRNGPPPIRASTSADASASQTTSPDVYLKSNFFASVPAPVRLTELRPTPHAPSPDTLRSLYTADLPIIVIDPLTTPLPSLSSLTNHPLSSEKLLPFVLPPHALVLIASASPASSSEGARERMERTLGIPASQVLLVDPNRAQSAAHALGGAAPTALNVQRYHDDSLGSGLSALRTTLVQVLDLHLQSLERVKRLRSFALRYLHLKKSLRAPQPNFPLRCRPSPISINWPVMHERWQTT